MIKTLRMTVLALATLAAAGASAQSTDANTGGAGGYGNDAGAGGDRALLIHTRSDYDRYPDRRLKVEGESFCQIRVGRGPDAHTFLRKCEKRD
jgi:hypothetical protein